MQYFVAYVGTAARSRLAIWLTTIVVGRTIVEVSVPVVTVVVVVEMIVEIVA